MISGGHLATLTGVTCRRSQLLSITAGLLVSLSLTFSYADQSACSSRAECREACIGIKQKIQKIQARMRSGYNAKQGERMQAELRRLRSIRAKVCR